MKLQSIGITLLTVALLGGSLAAPMAANAQNRRDDASQHRQETKNNWRNVAIGAGAVSVFGLLKHDNTIAFAGAAGALYSANRYEQDRKSQNKAYRARAQTFGQTSFQRNGHRYDRKTVTKNGQKYYQFVRR